MRRLDLPFRIAAAEVSERPPGERIGKTWKAGGAVFGSIDCRIEPSGDAERLVFTWESDDETDPLDGRGWAIINEAGQLEGRLYFHDGGDSGFTAEKTT